MVKPQFTTSQDQTVYNISNFFTTPMLMISSTCGWKTHPMFIYMARIASSFFVRFIGHTAAFITPEGNQEYGWKKTLIESPRRHTTLAPFDGPNSLLSRVLRFPQTIRDHSHPGSAHISPPCSLSSPNLNQCPCCQDTLHPPIVSERLVLPCRWRGICSWCNRQCGRVCGGGSWSGVADRAVVWACGCGL
ncbi:hypothetical protein BJX63DRAFT_385393 [Aspergillus granulosus]|uniref:Uncharacterized protein n=1 Tax=Aspergillus granulosus TaxID=176169 RepID=A0ABR4HQ83_9EURO